jgi:hypothetical protein
LTASAKVDGLPNPASPAWHDAHRRCMLACMCRNIRVLYNFAPPTTKEEIRAAAIQYVRKISGVNKPSTLDGQALEKAIDDIAGATEQLLASLKARTPVRSREGELEKARVRWKLREARLQGQR